MKNSYQFAAEIRDLKLSGNVVMASFDVESLFTNIPVQETIDIAVNSLFNTCATVGGIPRKLFRSMLDLAVSNSFFLFNNNLYKQTDGVGMGLPLGPTFANIFLCFHEKKWLSSCPSSFRPIYYRRYVDDCFLIFNDMSHVDKFLDFLNSQHPKMKFTKEVESNGALPFLDVTVKRSGATFETSVYRKPTFTGLGLSFFSFIPNSIKQAILSSALYRAYNISSTFKLFDREVSFLRNFFIESGFPKWLIETAISKFLNKQFTRSPCMYNVKKLEKYFVLPFFGKQSMKLRTEIEALLKKFYPFLCPRIVLRNSFSIGSLFRFKDLVPKASRSAVIYKFSCPSCGGTYIGSTYVRLYSRVCQHQGRSDRTGRTLASPVASSVRDHSMECDTPFSINDFQIIDRERGKFSLRILESLYIFKTKPSINDKSSAFKLNVIT